MTENSLVLYTGPLCHLCEEARRTVFAVLPSSITLRQVDITTDEQLNGQYRFSIPVLAVVAEDGRLVFEKPWPFSPGQVRRAIEDFILS